MRDQSEAPPEFVSYVERRLPALESAAHRLTGDDSQSERMSRELLSLVALRWRRLSRADAKHALTIGESADVYLTRLFRQEADELQYPHVMLNLNDTISMRRRGGVGAGLRAAEEAELIWEGARRVTRRRLILAGAAGAVLAVVALCQRRGGSSTESDTGPTAQARATVLPTGAERAPNEFSTTRVIRGVPRTLAVPADAPSLETQPLVRALVLMAATKADTSPIFVLGDDNKWRKLTNAPQLAALWMHAGSLSPDGTRAAFGTSSGTIVVDLTTGGAKTYHPLPETTRPIWLGPRHLLLSHNNLMDTLTGKPVPIPAGPTEAVTPRRPADPLGEPAARLLELLSVGQPSTAPARIRRWVGDGQEAVTPLNGPLTDLVGAWSGPGFGIDGENGLVVRACMPNNVPSVAQATAVIAVIRPKTGRVERALLVDSALTGNVRLLGWADERRVLMSIFRPGTQLIVTWDLLAGGLSVSSEVNSDGVLSLPDLSWVA